MAMEVLAVALSLLGMTLFYLASPHQQLRTTPLPGGAARLAGAAATLVALLVLVRLNSPGTGLFVLLTLAMAGLVALPCGGALRQLVRARGNGA